MLPSLSLVVMGIPILNAEIYIYKVQFSSVTQSCPWTAACQASLSLTNSRSLLKLMSIELVMPSNHLILCCPLLLLPSIFPSIRVFSNESVHCIKWPKYYIYIFFYKFLYYVFLSFKITLWFNLFLFILYYSQFLKEF